MFSAMQDITFGYLKTSMYAKENWSPADYALTGIMSFSNEGYSNHANTPSSELIQDSGSSCEPSLEGSVGFIRSAILPFNPRQGDIMIVYHERTGEPIEVAPCPFADDYPTWMDHEGRGEGISGCTS